MTSQQEIPTSAITFVESEHGRMRRKQRGIDKKDLQAAMKYGVRQNTHPTQEGHPASIYTHKDIVYIVDDITGREITSYAKPIQLDLIPVTEQMIQEHEEARKSLQQDLHSWTSNSVLVVDTSGSMRTADVWGARTRLSAVWLSIALDFIAQRIESGTAGNTDVISIITLGNDPKCVFQEEPTTWVLYNKIATVYNTASIQPFGHGPYLSSLRLAKKMLLRNPSASCATGLMFLSDGRPSLEIYKDQITNHEDILSEVQNLAKLFGRRLTFQTVAINGTEEMETIQILTDMVHTAENYGVIAELSLPSMNAISLGNSFTSIATSIAKSQIEMTNHATMKQLKVRSVLRESKILANQQLSTVCDKTFLLYPSSKVRREVYTEIRKETADGKRIFENNFEKVPLQHPNAKYVALAKEAFGEGAERLAFRFYEIASDMKTVVGKSMVAKENRFVWESSEESANERCDFVRRFCSTQQLARRLAKEFNDKLDILPLVDPKTPRISFLDCSIYHLDDINTGIQEVLVEEKLDHCKWRKWNSNNGYVAGMQVTPKFSPHSMREAMKQLCNVSELPVIDEDADEYSDTDEVVVESRVGYPSPIVFSPCDVAQAFSHFSYWTTGRKRLVCDLQGVHDEKVNELKLSDPVIHYYNPLHESRRCVHGRTDQGRKGMAMFFETHKEHCGQLCKLVIRGFHQRNQFKKRRCYE